MRKQRKFSEEFKKKVVEEYLSGKGWNTILREYDIVDSVFGRWLKKYEQYGSFPDGRGKSATGRPRKVDVSQMTQEEYIAYLEMENTILKQLRSLSNKQSR